MWNEGYMVKLDFSNDIKYELIPFTQCNASPKVSIEGTDVDLFLKKFKELSDVIKDDSKLKELNASFAMKNHKRYKLIFEPYGGRFCFGMYFRNLLPSFVKKNLTTKIDFIECEAHRDALLDVLKTL